MEISKALVFLVTVLMILLSGVLATIMWKKEEDRLLCNLYGMNAGYQSAEIQVICDSRNK